MAENEEPEVEQTEETQEPEKPKRKPKLTKFGVPKGQQVPLSKCNQVSK